ncbi:MAG: hypothetical protein QNJ38_22960 [Prochloraceae cyanobacterium]|nr:hypothetical protein [Prochloraceae cyanobacterium]
MNNSPPIPPTGFQDAIKSQIEYYQELREYHRAQWELADRKLARLKAFVQLELPDSPIIEKISEFPNLEAKLAQNNSNTSNIPPQTKTYKTSDRSAIDNAPIEKFAVVSTSGDLGFTSAQTWQKEPHSNQLAPLIEKEVTTESNAIEDLAEAKNFDAPKLEEVEVENKESRGQKASNRPTLPELTPASNETATSPKPREKSDKQEEKTIEKNRSSNNIKKKEKVANKPQLSLPAFPKDDYPDEYFNQQAVIPATAKAATTDEVSSTSDRLKTTVVTIEPESNQTKQTTEPKSITKEQLEKLFKLKKTIELAQSILKALNSAAPRAINVNEIVDWIYPNGLSSREYKKAKQHISEFLSNQLNKGLWIRVKRGFYRASNSQNSLTRSNEQKDSVDILTELEKTLNNLNKRSDILKTIQQLGTYREIVKIVMKKIGNNPTHASEICDWLDPNIPSKIKRDLINRFSKILSDLYRSGELNKVKTGYYILNQKESENQASQVENALTLESNKSLARLENKLDFNEYKSALENLFETEGVGAVLHYNYIGYKIFGTSHKEYNERLLEFLASGQEQKLWAQDPLDPNCWTKDLNLLPR